MPPRFTESPPHPLSRPRAGTPGHHRPLLKRPGPRITSGAALPAAHGLGEPQANPGFNRSENEICRAEAPRQFIFHNDRDIGKFDHRIKAIPADIELTETVRAAPDIDLVNAMLKIPDGVCAVAPVEDKPVRALAARENIISGTTGNAIIAAAADDPVRASLADKKIGADPASEHIIAATAIQTVIATATDQFVIASLAEKPVMTGAAKQPVISTSATKEVRTAIAENLVIAGIAKHGIIAPAT